MSVRVDGRLFCWGFLLGQLVVDVLLDGMGVGADDTTTVDEDRGRAADFEEVAVGDAGVNFCGGLRSGHASLEGVLIEGRLASEVYNLVVDVRSADQVLLIVDEIVELPKSFGVLLVGTAPGEGRGASPGMDGIEGEILEDEFDLRIVGKNATHGVVEIAADRAFEVGVLDDSDGGLGIAEDGGVGEVHLGAIFDQGILGHVLEFAAEEVAAVAGDIHFDVIGALVGFDFDVGFEDSRVPYFLWGGDGDLDVCAESESVAEIEFDIFLNGGWWCGGGLLRGRELSEGEGEQ